MKTIVTLLLMILGVCLIDAYAQHSTQKMYLKDCTITMDSMSPPTVTNITCQSYEVR